MCFKRYFMVDQQILQNFVQYIEGLSNSFYASQIIDIFINSRISANRDKGQGIQPILMFHYCTKILSSVKYNHLSKKERKLINLISCMMSCYWFEHNFFNQIECINYQIRNCKALTGSLEKEIIFLVLHPLQILFM